jgi:hypothetical protein
MSDKTHLRTLDSLDGRTRAAQRTHALIQSFEADLGRDPSAADLLAVRQAAMLTAIAEDAAARQLAGDAEDPSTLIPLVNAARRAVLDLGRNAQSEHSRLRRDKLQEGSFEETAERVRLIDEMDMASKITELFKQARETPFPSLVARAKQVRELLETARRRSDAKRPIRRKKAVDKLD